MTTKYLGSHQLVTEIGGFIQLGEEFDLEGHRFAPGTVGKVAQIYGQRAGRTECRIVITEGRILPENGQFSHYGGHEVGHKDINPGVVGEEDPNAAPLDTRSAKERFEMGHEAVQQQGGRDFVDRDPRPRTGRNSAPVNSQLPLVDPRMGSQGSRIITRDQMPAPNPTTVAMRMSFPTPQRQAGDVIATEEFAQAMGRQIDHSGEAEIPIPQGRKRRGMFRGMSVARPNPHDATTQARLQDDHVRGIGKGVSVDITDPSRNT